MKFFMKQILHKVKKSVKKEGCIELLEELNKLKSDPKKVQDLNNLGEVLSHSAWDSLVPNESNNLELDQFIIFYNMLGEVLEEVLAAMRSNQGGGIFSSKSVHSVRDGNMFLRNVLGDAYESDSDEDDAVDKIFERKSLPSVEIGREDELDVKPEVKPGVESDVESDDDFEENMTF